MQAVINPLELPSLPLKQRRTFPKIPAVYLVIAKPEEVLYVGRSLNLQGRWLTHQLLKKLENPEDIRIAWVEVSDITLFAAIENALINHFKPIFNKRGLLTPKLLKTASVKQAEPPISKEEFLTLSYRELKRLTGVDIKNWSEWLNSKSSPCLDSLERVALDLGMSLPEFIDAFKERRTRTTDRKAE